MLIFTPKFAVLIPLLEKLLKSMSYSIQVGLTDG